MDLILIRADGELKQVFIGQTTDQILLWVEELNKNPLVKEEWTVSETYTEKSIYELADFLGIEIHK